MKKLRDIVPLDEATGPGTKDHFISHGKSFLEHMDASGQEDEGSSYHSDLAIFHENELNTHHSMKKWGPDPDKSDHDAMMDDVIDLCGEPKPEKALGKIHAKWFGPNSKK